MFEDIPITSESKICGTKKGILGWEQHAPN